MHCSWVLLGKSPYQFVPYIGSKNLHACKEGGGGVKAGLSVEGKVCRSWVELIIGTWIGTHVPTPKS